MIINKIHIATRKKADELDLNSAICEICKIGGGFDSFDTMQQVRIYLESGKPVIARFYTYVPVVG